MVSRDGGGYLTSPRHAGDPACEETLRAGTLVCNLKLAHHTVHHDPDGFWWAACTMPGHGHGEDHGREVHGPEVRE